MKGKGRFRRKRRKKITWLAVAALIMTIVFAIGIIKTSDRKKQQETPEKILLNYMNCISEKRYEDMYSMLSDETLGEISQENFIKRNSAIYEGMEVQNLTVTIISYDEEKGMVQYRTSFDTVAGNISFDNEAFFLKEEDGYKLMWEDSLIYPELSSMDKIRVSAEQAKRGQILDRNGRVLAGKGTASSVGIVPGKLENWDDAIEQIANLLGMETEEIEKKLSAKWVREDSFVPIKTVKKVEEIELMSLEPDAEILQEYERQQKLLEIPGIMISDTEVRNYPLGNAAAHLVGYVQSVTAEDLEKHMGEGYTANSVIGRSGAEGLFESKLKGQNGYRIYIVDGGGNEKQELACRRAENGKDIKLTIDSELQIALYEQFKEDKSCSAAMNPYTGEVLALVSTPSYDNNDFIMGLSNEKWTALNEDEDKPMFNRFRQVWCPGSTFKPITAAIGLESGAIDPNEDYGNVGLSWQKDSSWGSYYVTTLHTYEPVVLENALIYSDNIYFAKAALKIGAEEMRDSLLKLGFQEELPFEIVMAKSQYSNTEDIETEIQLADSGYGQGQILVNPLHMACIYTAFCNEGTMIKPYLVYSQEAKPEYWIPNAFSANTANLVLEGMKKAVNDPHGTGYAAHREDVLLAGKTGTAEIKASKDDTSGTELGWFAVFTEDKTIDNPILIVSMVEDVKGKGGSGYVVEKDKQVLESWFDSIEETYQDIYDDAIETNTLGSLEIKRCMITRLGENGYAAVDSENQIDMAGAEQVVEFCKTVEKKENDKLTIIVLTDSGFRKLDMQTEDGNVNIVSGYYECDQNGHIQNKSTVSYPADLWQYTEEGYLLFEGSYFSDENYVLTLSNAQEYTALRVLPLDETCRELNRKYILPVGYEQNNMFLTDWSEEDFGDLDLYDVFDVFYPILYRQPIPYAADENLGAGAVYQIPEEIFETVIMTYFNIDRETLRRETRYFPEDGAYEYRPRGFYEAEYPDIPYPEVVSYTENEDGTIALIINAVYPNGNTSRSFSHRTVIRPISESSFRYVSNQTISIEDENDIWWHSERLSEEEWEEIYGGTG